MRHRTGFLAPLYYDELRPDHGPARSIVLVHGGSVTGACWLSTPDGRPGCAHAFAEHR